MKSLAKHVAGAACCAALLGSGTAQAHYLWIESGDEGARLYFGEPDVLLKEKSPGKLDSIKAPQASVVDAAAGKPATAAIKRVTDHFAIDGAKAAAAVLVMEESLEVRDLSKHGLGHAKSNYYARQGRPAGSTATSLSLDVMGSAPNTLTVLFRGQPLPNAKLEVIAPNTWVQEHTTDAQGMLQINTPWRGQYVVHVLHVDKTPGEFAGKRYDNLRNHFTYTFVKPDGAAPGPAVSPKQPME